MAFDTLAVLGAAAVGSTIMNNAEMRGHPDVFDVTVTIAGEAPAVAQALGVQVEPVGGIPAQAYLDGARGVGLDDLRALWVEHGQRVGRDAHRSSRTSSSDAAPRWIT